MRISSIIISSVVSYFLTGVCSTDFPSFSKFKLPNGSRFAIRNVHFHAVWLKFNTLNIMNSDVIEVCGSCSKTSLRITIDINTKITISHLTHVLSGMITDSINVPWSCSRDIVFVDSISSLTCNIELETIRSYIESASRSFVMSLSRVLRISTIPASRTSHASSPAP